MRVSVLLLLVAPLALVACASTVDGAPGDAGPGGLLDRPGVFVDGPDAGRDVPYFDTNAYDVYRGDVCPGGRLPAIRRYDCDPFAARNCSQGMSCRPWIDYPTVQCGAEVYRSSCFADGPVAAGGFCRVGNDCQPGSACFVTGAMNRCLRLCRLDGSDPQCPRGSVCEPTDLPDYGACQ